jgi:MATE family, multidrug efflux pump
VNAADPPQRYAVTNARVLAIAIPMTLANITTPLLGVVGSAVIGRLGEAHLLGGVAMASIVFDCVFWLFAFLRMGTVALTAQALGRNDIAEERATLIRALIVAGTIGLALIVLQVPLGATIFQLMGASAEVTAAARSYFAVRIWSAPFVFANLVMLGWFVGLGRAATALSLQVAINLINVVVTMLLVLHYELGVAGAAAGALAGEATGTLAGLVLAIRAVGARLPDITLIFDRARLIRLFAVNRDIFIRTAALIVAWGFFARQGARSGDVVLAANAVLNNLVLVGAFFVEGFAAAAQQLCGRAVGAHDGPAFSRAVRLAIAWGFGFGAAATLILLAFGPWLIDLMTASGDVRVTARAYLGYAALASAIGAFAFAYDGIYIGATWTRELRNLMVLALAFYLATWWLTQPLGNTGLWLALLVFFGARGALQAARYPTLAKAAFSPATARP